MRVTITTPANDIYREAGASRCDRYPLIEQTSLKAGNKSLLLLSLYGNNIALVLWHQETVAVDNKE